MMADENVNTGDENKRTTVWHVFDEDESGDKWFPPNGKMAEYSQSDEGGTDEASGQDDMQSFDEWSRQPCEEDCDIGSTESVAKYTQGDDGGSDEASVHDGMQSSSAKWSHPSVEDNAIGSIQLDDVDNTLGHNSQRIGTIYSELCDILTRLGPQKAEEYIKKHLNRWKTEKVKFAVAGQAATGKSTFINTFRGIKEGQDGFADVGFGDETDKISVYTHPLNKNIIFCDFPGLSMKFTKRKYLEMVNLSEYNYVFIFFTPVPSEDDQWLMEQIQEKGVPFCLVRSKIDQDVESHKGRKIGEKSVLLQIREKINNSIAEHTAFANVELFIISSEKPHIGEMSILQDHMKEKLPSNQFSAVMLSFPILTDAVIEKKLLELKKRIPYVSIGTAIIAAVPIPLIINSTAINMDLVKHEVRHYVTVFGLDQMYDENIEGLTNNFSDVSVNDFVERKFTEIYRFHLLECVPIIGSIIAGTRTKKIVDAFLSYVLSELKHDAITVCMHFLNKGSR